MKTKIFAALIALAAIVMAALLFAPKGEIARPKEVAGWPRIKISKVVTGVLMPTSVTNAGDGSGRLFVTEQTGRVRIIRDGRLLEKPFLDIGALIPACVGQKNKCGEEGLFSIAFPEGFKDKKYFYVSYVRKSDIASTVSRFTVSDDPDVANVDSEETIIAVPERTRIHNGGQIAFGPDGYLYVSFGDGGPPNDPHNASQDPRWLLGKIIRIDVETDTKPYAIPPDNPFVGKEGYRPEIWFSGFRNPWRFSFDRATGDMYIGDVGQSEREGVSFAPAGSKGLNFGWSVFEGSKCFKPEFNCEKTKKDFVFPFAEYDHSAGVAVTGGYVFRGEGSSNMRGAYFFADYFFGKIWAARKIGGEWKTKLLFTPEPNDFKFWISSFGEGEDGSLYFAQHQIREHTPGAVWRIEEAGPDEKIGITMTTDEKIAKGALVYADYRSKLAGGAGETDEDSFPYVSCVSCHGWDLLAGKGGNSHGVIRSAFEDVPYQGPAVEKIFSSLSKQNYTKEMILHEKGRAISVRERAMPSYKEVLTDKQIDYLVTFLNSPESSFSSLGNVTVENGKISYSFPKGNAGRGKAFYAKTCERCHGGVDNNENLIGESFASYLKQAGALSKVAFISLWGLPNESKMRSAMGFPTTGQVADLLAYLQTVKNRQKHGR